MDSDRLLTVLEVSERLSLPASETRKLLRTAALAGFRIGRRLRVSEKALIEFMEARRLGKANVASEDRPTNGKRG